MFVGFHEPFQREKDHKIIELAKLLARLEAEQLLHSIQPHGIS